MSIWILLFALAFPVIGQDLEDETRLGDIIDVDQMEATTMAVNMSININNTNNNSPVLESNEQKQITPSFDNLISTMSNQPNDTVNDTQQDQSAEDKLESNEPPLNLSRLLDIYCPGESVCVNGTLNVTSDQSDSTSKGCCTACSCSNTCHTTHDCCFPSTDDRDEIRHTSCYSSLYPIIEEFYNEFLGHTSYKMIDSLTLNSGDNSSADCGNKTVAPWGSLFPVYSKTRRVIYKNDVCAAADGADDVTRFKAFVACAYPDNVSRGRLLDRKRWDKFEEWCDVFFEPPVSQFLPEEHLCYLDLVSTCPEQFDDDAIKSACTSGLLSPYRDHRGMLYKNVFCADCHRRFFREHCADDTTTKVRHNRNFITLLDDTAYESFDISFPMENVKQACLMKDGVEVEETCRPVQCSTGQTLNKDGMCMYIMKAWFKAIIVVQLNLTSDVWLNITDLSKSDFTTKWSRNWNIDMIYTLSNEDIQLTKSVIVLLARSLQYVNQKSIIKSINVLKDTKWTAKTSNGSVSLNAEFAKARDHFDNAGLYWRHIKHFFEPSVEAEGYGSSAAVYLIDRMFYCEQVNLRSHEFVGDQQVLYNKITGEQSIAHDFYYPDVYDRSIARVCVEDSGLKIRSSGSQHHSMIISKAVFVLTRLYFIWYVSEM